MAMSHGAGKTAPRLLEDLLNYDPRLQARHGRNILTTLPPPFEPDKLRPPTIPQGSCRHSFLIKYDQSQLPNAADSLDRNTTYKVSSYCGDCRYHLDLHVDFHACESPDTVCPTAESPLHHFLYVSDKAKGGAGSVNDTESNNFPFQCSNNRCQAILWIRLRPPHLTERFVHLLTDPEVLQARHAAAIKATDQSNLKAAKSIEVLSYLRTYVTDAMDPESTRKRIPVRNKKFSAAFGQDCEPVLTSIGFTKGGADEEDCWYLPNAGAVQVPKASLEDVREELNVLIRKRPLVEQRTLKSPLYEGIPSLNDIERALRCHNYLKTRAARTTIDYTIEEHPYYASLGALGTFADELLLFAYDRQVQCDPSNSDYYFECLEDLARGRKSELLEMKVMTLASQGLGNRREVDNAYRYLGLNPKSEAEYTDEHIVGLFKSRLPDVSAAQEGEMREMLRIIGQSRRSELILQESSNAIETYPQALSWLNVDESTLDDFVVTMVTVKINESAANTEIARKAVEIIAEARNSDALRSWLNTGELGEQPMDLAEAYRIFGIQDRSAQVDSTALGEAYRFALQDLTHPKEQLDMAYSRIMKEQFGRPDEAENANGAPKYPPETWPVGFQNIGNTCYLNSLLQFFFTVKPLRDLVLNFEDFKMDLESQEATRKRVGGREVTKEEISKAQEFVVELRKLFHDMIIAPGPSVRPEVKLACLALKTLKSEDDGGDDQKASDQVKGLGTLDGLPVSGPLLPQPNASKESLDAPSDCTLVGENSVIEKSDVEMGDVKDTQDNRSIQGIEAGQHMLSEHEKIPSNNSSSDDSPSSTVGNINASALLTPPESDDGNKSDSSTLAQPGGSNLPTQPPPIPPRPKAGEQSNTVPADVEFAAKQQDVSEVINNIIFQLECAIRPEKVKDGEQWDLLKRLFYGEVAKSYFRAGKHEVKRELFDTIFVSVNSGPQHIYPALDDEFDLLDIDTESQEADSKDSSASGTIQKFESISLAPPFLQINVRRVDYDPVTQRAIKVEHPLYLEKQIYLDRYLLETESVGHKDLFTMRKDCWDWKKRLKACRQRRAEIKTSDVDMSLPEAVDEGANFIANLYSDDTDDGLGSLSNIDAEVLAEAMRRRAAQLRREVAMLDEQIEELEQKIQTQFSSLKDYPYSIHSVFKHRGSAGGGHYYVYIYDFQNHTWRKYNDTNVDEVTNEDEIFQQDARYPATSTSIFYVRSEQEQRLTEAVKRKPPPPEPPAEHDQMEVDTDASEAPIGVAITADATEKTPSGEDLEVINGQEAQGNQESSET